jgi:hypothetical protein
LSPRAEGPPASGPRPKITISGGDPIVGRYLEALLQAAGYRAWFLPEDRVDEVDELFADSQLLIITPAPSSRFRKVLLDTISTRQTAEIPILELLPVNGEHLVRGEHMLPWPCLPETLKRVIASILFDSEE